MTVSPRPEGERGQGLEISSMIPESDKKFVQECLDHHFASFPMVFPEVPEEMYDGEHDGSDWVKWKRIPSRVTEKDVRRLEARLPGPFPPLFNAYLACSHVLGMESFNLPSLPPDEPLADLEATIQGWACLLDAGYVAFVDNAEGDVCPLCFEIASRLPDGDYPLVLFDHESLINLGEEKCRQREHVQPLGERRYESFRDMLGKRLL